MNKRILLPALMVFPLMLFSQRFEKADSLKYYKFMAEAYYDMVGDYASSSYYLSKAIRIDPEDFELYQMRALARGNTGKTKGEVDDYTKVIQLDPGNIAAYVGRFQALLKLNHFQEAINDLDFLIEVDPEYYGFYYQRGMARFKLNDNKGGCQDLNMASRLGSIEAHLELYESCME